MKEMFIVMVADVHVDCAYDAHFEAHAIPHVFGSYAEASKAAAKASRKYRDVEILCVDPESGRIYGTAVEVEYAN